MPLGRLLLITVSLVASTGLASAQHDRADWDRQRARMVEAAIIEAGVTNQRVVSAMRATRRHEFVPLAQRRLAYQDMALPIGASQTISPPFVVAYMTEQLDPQPTDKVLEIGTGSGYQAAVLSPLVADVYTIEIVPSLGKRAAKTLSRLDYDNVHARVGDGYQGWPEAAPFDKIIVTCSPENPPPKLVEQLAEGGRMVIPLGERFQQNLCLMRKVNGELEREPLRATLFVPMTGAAEERREVLPDPERPAIVNGSFDEIADDEMEEPLPAGWHYLRQAEIDAKARPDDPAIAFKNDEPGLPSQALQGFPIDGRRVKRLRVGFAAKGEGIRFGQQASQWPYVVVSYYDERRVWLGDEVIGPLRGSFDWIERSEELPVPASAREAGLRIGLLGAVGKLWLDDVRIAPAGG
ncbi:Protein-L-isoaspartate O-methyltransferase [Botrimarina colliarenosi]|uniref:Protein-L-isoaspartate O-methyltransferase n=1 Tax=Botrimarina colliarenosi TaxID=2528001 RepID=A0A5C6AFS1_9BACT|nr:protein-L-isoaspartate(D-aspartate) O-methyltransferase [Botrimarina colliarenosi]TWT97911.1 Protein-L-isoaspartate O-methyltransferase [Botrimarina colliarenosi]